MISWSSSFASSTPATSRNVTFFCDEDDSLALLFPKLNARLPRTLIHSDVHVSNWYRTADGQMGLSDWGCVAKGNGARDLAYALGTALTIEDRRAWEADLVEIYLDSFAAHGGTRPSIDDTLDLYRRHLVCALLMWTPTLCHSPLLPDMQPRDVSIAMIERITAALSDHEVLQGN